MQVIQYYVILAPMELSTAKLTSKSQASVPAAVRERLGLKPGDVIAFELTDDGQVQLRKAHSLDTAFAAAVGSTLSEWDSDEDEQAYGSL